MSCKIIAFPGRSAALRSGAAQWDGPAQPQASENHELASLLRFSSPDRWQQSKLAQLLQSQMKNEGSEMDFKGERDEEVTVPGHIAGPAPSRILLADDHFLFADALKSMLQARWPGCETVHVENAADLEQYRPLSQSFDIVLLDLRMPGMDKPQQIAHIVEMAEGAPVVLMSGLATGTEIESAFRAGISGFIPKSRPGDEFLDFMAGVLSSDPDRRVVQSLFEQDDAVLSKLSPRETETARLMARGLSNKEIAVELQISPETVKVYTKSIMTKFSVRNRTEFAIEAVRRGIV